MAFGDNGPKKKTPFERLTMFVILVMLIVTIAGIIVTAFSAIM